MNLDLLAGMTINEVSSKWGGLPTGSLMRHRLGYLDRSIRRPDPIDENRTAADVLVGLANTLSDLDRLRADALQHGRSSAAIKAASEYRVTARLIFSDLGINRTAVAGWIADHESVWGAIRRWARTTPGVLTALAQHIDDPRLQREPREGHDLLMAAQAQREKENAA